MATSGPLSVQPPPSQPLCSPGGPAAKGGRLWRALRGKVTCTTEVEDDRTVTAASGLLRCPADGPGPVAAQGGHLWRALRGEVLVVGDAPKEAAGSCNDSGDDREQPSGAMPPDSDACEPVSAAEPCTESRLPGRRAGPLPGAAVRRLRGAVAVAKFVARGATGKRVECGSAKSPQTAPEGSWMGAEGTPVGASSGNNASFRSVFKFKLYMGHPVTTAYLNSEQTLAHAHTHTP